MRHATSTLEAQMVALDVPGVAVAIMIDGVVAREFAVGVTADGQPMAPTTLTQVGSVSKPVAAIGCVALAGEGVLPWDTSIEAVLTTYELPRGAQTDAAPVTIAGLLSHTAGTTVDGFFGYASAAEAPTVAEVLAGEGNTAALEVALTPGTAFVYSGGGYELVEQAMLDATRAPSFDALMREYVFGPAGMDDSFYALDLTTERAACATPGSMSGVVLPNRWQAHPESAAAGLWTTAHDLALLLRAFGASLRGEPGGLLAPEWARRMVGPAIATDGGAVGYGWFLDRADSPAYFAHNGRNIGYCAHVAGSTDGRLGVAVVTNSFPGGTQLAREIIETTAVADDWPDWTNLP
jgi:CubicO group peptidase (beta-lactamase class C family)